MPFKVALELFGVIVCALLTVRIIWSWCGQWLGKRHTVTIHVRRRRGSRVSEPAVSSSGAGDAAVQGLAVQAPPFDLPAGWVKSGSCFVCAADTLVTCPTLFGRWKLSHEGIEIGEFSSAREAIASVENARHVG